MLHAPLGSHAVRGSIEELGSRLVDALLYVPRLGYHFEVTADANGTFLEPAALPGLHLASSCGCRPDPVVCALRTIGDSTHYVRRLARGLRSHDDARSRVGDLRNALTLARDHEAPSQNPGP